MKKVIKSIFTIILIYIIVIMQTTISIASNKTNLQNQQSDLDSKIKEKEEEIENIEEEKSEVLSQVKKLVSDISSYEQEIDELESKITNLKNQIEEAEKNIKVQEEEYVKQKELLNERLVVMYENGETSYLDVLCSSESIVDFISNYYLVSEIANYDTELLEKIENKRKEIENKKATLEKNKTELDNSKKSKEAKANQLKVAKLQKDEVAAKLTAEEKQAQAELEQFEADKKAIQAELKRIAEEEAAAAKKNNSTTTNITNNPSKSGYIKPVVGYSITTGYGKYSWGGNHTGVDYSGSGISGKPILAVKDGRVVTSTALKTSSGKYKSYGEYIVISHGDGTMTLYAHGQAGSRKVTAGQNVKQGQHIMNVGSTGNSTGPHLHFEVRVNGKPVNPTPYLP